ncbi:DUF3750 domain-containing protein [Motiliproteus sediminis]|uniref:DUF3750 domain-containing protein n=1 Tax=Motiliproteus sediminis TaxID=1468178 RepID=UPI001AEFB478|nr:DUF3750 domain-containing protein [Motiliproteus sediminis]
MRLYSLWLIVPVLAVILVARDDDGWRTASREPAGIAPDPMVTDEAVLQVYGASAYGWRGWFGIHTWIAVKPEGASRYTVYDVVGWRVNHGQPALRVYQDYPDRYWFGSRPQLLLDRRGAGVEQLIEAVDQAAKRYPWANEYRLFPGPNSNTFPAWIGLQVPELGLELPVSAIGRDYADTAR